MKQVPPALQAHLDGIATSLCRCWRLTRRDGRVLGFTDHDEPIRFDGVTFEAASGLSASAVEREIGLSASTQEVDGALSSLAIEEKDILAGRYDGAIVETFLVNWDVPDQRILLGHADLGEVKRRGERFTAELRGLAARLDRPNGRFYRRRCDAVLGDARCGIDLTQARWRRNGRIIAVEADGTAVLSGLDPIEPESFAHGRAQWQDGEAAGAVVSLASVGENGGGGGGGRRIAFVGGPPSGAAIGDRLVLLAGCDRSFATCRARFANELNFRGFPHLPGSDVALGLAKTDGRHDGAAVMP